MAEELQLSRLPTYSALNLFALLLTLGLLGGSGLLGLVYAYVAAMCAAAAAIFAAAAYVLAPGASAESYGFKREVLTLILPSTSALMFIALFSAAGGYFYWVTMVMAIALMLLYKPQKMPKPDIKLGVLGGITMFIAVILLTSLLSLAGLLSVTVEAALLSWAPVSLSEGQDPLAAQLYAVQTFLIVALGEELWARLTLGYGGSAVAGPRTAWFWSTLWFLYMHTPSRLQYGFLAPVIIALLGAVMLVFMVFFRRNPSVWTGVVMHATYNTLLAGLYYGTLLLDLAVLAVLLSVLYRVTEAKVVIRLPKLEEVVVAGG